MTRGLMPYRDLFDHKGPLLFMLYALGAAISDTSFIGVFALEALSLAAAVYAGWRTVRLFGEGRLTLLAMPLTTSMDTYAELISWRKDSPREYRYRISVNPLPKNARIRVLVMVPTMSRPMFIPERNSSRRDSWGLAAWTSAREEAMPMVTSITAPRALMMMPPTSRPRRPMGVPVWRLSLIHI